MHDDDDSYEDFLILLESYEPPLIRRERYRGLLAKPFSKDNAEFIGVPLCLSIPIYEGYLMKSSTKVRAQKKKQTHLHAQIWNFPATIKIAISGNR